MIVLHFIDEKLGHREAQGLAEVTQVVSRGWDQNPDLILEPTEILYLQLAFQPRFCLMLQPSSFDERSCYPFPSSLLSFLSFPSVHSFNKYFLCTCCLLSIDEIKGNSHGPRTPPHRAYSSSGSFKLLFPENTLPRHISLDTLTHSFVSNKGSGQGQPGRASDVLPDFRG